MKKNLLLAFFSLLFSLIFAEILLHFFVPNKVTYPESPKTNWAIIPENKWIEYHPILGWKNMPNKTSVLSKNGWSVEAKTNSIGLRGVREYALKKETNMKRMIALGDSFVFGFGVKDDETFSAALEKHVPGLEVPNFGVAGYGVDQISLTYGEIAKQYEADYVLICLFPEDFWRSTRSFTDAGYVKPYFSLTGDNKLVLHNVPAGARYSLNTNQFPDIIHYSPLEELLLKSYLYRIGKRTFMRLGKNLKIVDPDTTPEWILGKATLKDLVAQVRQSGAKPVILIMPPDQWIVDYSPKSLRKAILRFAEKNKIDILDLTPPLHEAVQKSSLADYYIENDGHWTAKGHALVADQILNYLKGTDPAFAA